MKRLFRKAVRFIVVAVNYCVYIYYCPFYKHYFKKHKSFYRRHSPFSRPLTLGIRQCDRRTVVDTERKFLFNRLTKVASSALMVTLKPKTENGKEQKKFKQKHKRPSKLKKRDMKKTDDLFKFIFVRNPYDRILSAYLHKIGTDNERREKFKKPVPGLFKKYGDKPTFYEFCRYLEDGGLYENKHLAPQVSLMALPKEEFSFIGKFENIEEDFKKVTDKVKNLDGRDMKRGGTYTGASDKRKKYYDLETAGIVYHIYREDFETFNYSRNLAD